MRFGFFKTQMSCWRIAPVSARVQPTRGHEASPVGFKAEIEPSPILLRPAMNNSRS
jgi:hypothetical protein